MNHIFFKTVRSDGSSLWAHGKLCKNYKLGKTYKFPERLPAHVFLADAYGLVSLHPRHEHVYSSQRELSKFLKNPPIISNQQIVDAIYNGRAEFSAGNRVLVCMGKVEPVMTPVFCIQDNWNFLLSPSNLETRWGSTEFKVIGELNPSRRGLEIPKRHRDLKIQGINKYLKNL